VTKPFADQIALVTGASRGIGAATAKALAAGGAHVLLTARDSKALESVEQEIHEAGGTATIAPMDLIETDAIARLATAVAHRWGKLDILVINAAVLPSLAPVGDIDLAGFNRAIATNVLAPQALIASFDKLLRKSDNGRVVGLTSTVAASPRAFWGAYGATKAALENLLASYGQEVRNISKVRVALVNPGATRTAMRARAYPGEDPAKVKSPIVVAEALIKLLGEDFTSPHHLAL
jgi:NAD(P)-dependent dehydrogenase (short-subunit alcohol dehydrogenase family)